MKIYGVRPIALIYNTVLYLVGIFTGVIIGLVIFPGKSILIGLAAGAILFIFLIRFYISQLRFKVIVDGDTVEFVTKKKSEKYNIDEASFSSKITDKSDLKLTVMLGNKVEYYDCSFLGYTKFMELLEDLKVVGENQKTVKLDTRK